MGHKSVLGNAGVVLVVLSFLRDEYRYLDAAGTLAKLHAVPGQNYVTPFDSLSRSRLVLLDELLGQGVCIRYGQLADRERRKRTQSLLPACVEIKRGGCACSHSKSLRLLQAVFHAI